LLEASTARDVDGDPLRFRIESLTAGRIEKWNGRRWVAVQVGPAQPTSSGTQAPRLGPGERIRWVPPAGATGTIPAFTISVFDGQLWSLGSSQVSIEFSNNGWQNPANRYDVNDDNSVTPLDALLILNYLAWSFRQSDASQPAEFQAPYYDVNGDGMVTPLDALLVLNSISHQNRQGDGELSASTIVAIPASPFVPLKARDSLTLADQSPVNAGCPPFPDAKRPATSFNDLDVSAVHILDEVYRDWATQPVLTCPELDADSELDKSIHELAGVSPHRSARKTRSR